VKHEVLPGELTTFRAVGATGFGLGAAGGLALWVTEPGAIHSDPVAAATTVLCLALAVAMAFVPWQRLGQGWQVAPPIVGVAVIAAAIQNMEDGRAVYDGFYLYVALAASYFLPGRHLRFVITAIAVASAVPLLGDARAESVVRWAYVAAGTATMALVLRSARKQVREYASQVRRLALVDQLTGALNRRGFEARANAELSRARRHEQEVTLIYLDLDGFKQVNDNLGTGPATWCCAARRSRWARRCAARTCSRASAATSSWRCSGSSRPSTRRRSPTGWSARSGAWRSRTKAPRTSARRPRARPTRTTARRSTS
jgi:hypothetical protein